jgi:hypothetical protein
MPSAPPHAMNRYYRAAIVITGIPALLIAITYPARTSAHRRLSLIVVNVITVVNVTPLPLPLPLTGHTLLNRYYRHNVDLLLSKSIAINVTRHVDRYRAHRHYHYCYYRYYR